MQLPDPLFIRTRPSAGSPATPVSDPLTAPSLNATFVGATVFALIGSAIKVAVAATVSSFFIGPPLGLFRTLRHTIRFKQQQIQFFELFNLLVRRPVVPLQDPAGMI